MFPLICLPATLAQTWTNSLQLCPLSLVPQLLLPPLPRPPPAPSLLPSRLLPVTRMSGQCSPHPALTSAQLAPSSSVQIFCCSSQEEKHKSTEFCQGSLIQLCHAFAKVSQWAHKQMISMLLSSPDNTDFQKKHNRCTKLSLSLFLRSGSNQIDILSYLLSKLLEGWTLCSKNQLVASIQQWILCLWIFRISSILRLNISKVSQRWPTPAQQTLLPPGTRGLSLA